MHKCVEKMSRKKIHYINFLIILRISRVKISFDIELLMVKILINNQRNNQYKCCLDITNYELHCKNIKSDMLKITNITIRNDTNSTFISHTVIQKSFHAQKTSIALFENKTIFSTTQ